VLRRRDAREFARSLLLRIQLFLRASKKVRLCWYNPAGFAVRDKDGRKLDHKTPEALRIRAVAGSGKERIRRMAAALGLHRKTVYDWLAKYREGG
jgi:hypothetical protein